MRKCSVHGLDLFTIYSSLKYVNIVICVFGTFVEKNRENISSTNVYVSPGNVITFCSKTVEQT